MDAQTYQLSKNSIKTLKVDNYLKSYIAMVLNVAMFCAALYLFLSKDILLYVSGVILWAFQMNHAYLIVHESGHGTFLKKNWMNEICGNIFALFAFLPFYSRRFEHAMHHRVAGSFEEPSTKRALKRFSLINPRAAFFITICWKCWIPIFSLNEHVMLWGLAFQKDGQKKMRVFALISLTIYAAAIIALLIAGRGMLLARFLPVMYLYMMLIEFFNLPHHLSSPIEDRHGPVPYYEQSKYSRSCSPMPAPFGNWLLLNFNYHIAHHLYPTVHWTRLGEAHKIMTGFDPDLGETAHEFTMNAEMRKKSLREALSKFFDHQYKYKEARQV